MVANITDKQMRVLEAGIEGITSYSSQKRAVPQHESGTTFLAGGKKGIEYVATNTCFDIAMTYMLCPEQVLFCINTHSPGKQSLHLEVCQLKTHRQRTL